LTTFGESILSKTKMLLVFPALTFCAVAHAQSSVTLYGQIESGVTYVSNQAGGKTVMMADSIERGDRLGFKGTEDLGGGLAAIFTLENGFNIDTGQLRQGGRMFGRQAFVGLQNQWGSVTLGRGYDMIYYYTSQFDVSGWASGYASHQGDYDREGFERQDNNLTFRSADFKGFSFGGLYSFGNVAGDFHKGSSWSAGGQYTHGPYAFGVAYTRLNNPNSSDSALDPYAQIGVATFLGQRTISVNPATGAITDLFGTNSMPIDSEGIVTAGASYKLGRVTFIGTFTNVTFKGFGQTSNMPTFDVGGAWQINPAWITIAGYQHTNFEGHSWNQYSWSLDYSLSKRTDVGLSASYVMASAGVGANSAAWFTPSSTSRQADVRIAIHHSF
jgi:outer membrane protein OmpU